MVNRWLAEYKGLAKYKWNFLYCITGPFVLGIEQIKIPRVDQYRPHFVVYSLYGLPTGTTIKECLSYPVLMSEMHSKKGLQYSLDYEEDISEVKESLDEFLTFSLGANVSFDSMLLWLDRIVNDPLKKSRIHLPEVWEVRYNLALYISDDRANQILAEINDSVEKIDREKCLKHYGGFSHWYKELTSRNRTEHLKLIRENRNSKELRSLLQFEIE